MNRYGCFIYLWMDIPKYLAIYYYWPNILAFDLFGVCLRYLLFVTCVTSARIKLYKRNIFQFSKFCFYRFTVINFILFAKYLRMSVLKAYMEAYVCWLFMCVHYPVDVLGVNKNMPNSWSSWKNKFSLILVDSLFNNESNVITSHERQYMT